MSVEPHGGLTSTARCRTVGDVAPRLAFYCREDLTPEASLGCDGCSTGGISVAERRELRSEMGTLETCPTHGGESPRHFV